MNDDSFENELRKFQFLPPPTACRTTVLAVTKDRRKLFAWLPWVALAACWIVGLSLQADAGTLVWQRPAAVPQSQPMPTPIQRDEAILQLLAELNAALRDTAPPNAPKSYVPQFHVYPDQTNHPSHESKSKTLG